MAAISDNKYDVYNWIIQVIDSCETQYHYNTMHILIVNFRKRYKDDELASPLWNYLNHQQFK